MHATGGPGFEVAVYRQETVVALPHVDHPASPHPKPHKVLVWAQHDVLFANKPTAEQALEYAMEMLDEKCE
jgi:hypothetical protein